MKRGLERALFYFLYIFKTTLIQMIKIFPLGLAIFFLFSCSGRKKKEVESRSVTTTIPPVQKDSFQKSVMIPSVVSYKDASLSYALYLPHQYDDRYKLPALIFF